MRGAVQQHGGTVSGASRDDVCTKLAASGGAAAIWAARGEHAWRDHGLRFTVHEGCVHSTTTRPETGQEQDSHSRVPGCQRTLQAAADKRVLVRWVKVKGHSNEEGNDMADKLADYAQKGGAQNEQDIAMMMARLQA